MGADWPLSSDVPYMAWGPWGARAPVGIVGPGVAGEDVFDIIA